LCALLDDMSLFVCFETETAVERFTENRVDFSCMQKIEVDHQINQVREMMLGVEIRSSRTSTQHHSQSAYIRALTRLMWNETRLSAVALSKPHLF
jgi:hypothetical protein